MSLGVSEVYQLRFQFGEQDVTITPASIKFFQIDLYLDRFLPTITCMLRDDSGFLTNLTPFDSRYNKMVVNFNNDTTNDDDAIDISFKIFRRKPKSIVQMSNNVLFHGILDIQNMFNPEYQNGWVNTNLDEIIESALDVTNFDETNIVTNVGSPQTVIQPHHTTAQFMTFLADNTKSDDGSSGFLTFTDLPGFLKTRFNFVSLSSLLKQQSTFTFLNSPQTSSANVYPIYDIKPMDNFDLISNMGVSQQSYGYFDYFTGKYIQRTIPLGSVDFKCLSEYFAYDSQDNIDGLSQSMVGVTNDFIKDYDAIARGNYYKKLNSLVKMWIVTSGNNQINPGSIITIIYPEVHDNVSIVSYQYSGDWLVERVRHNFGATYLTSLLLTRPGYDTDQSTTFVKRSS
jgi:hypothetical protein